MDARHHETEETYQAPEIDMIDVESSNIARIGHNTEREVL